VHAGLIRVALLSSLVLAGAAAAARAEVRVVDLEGRRFDPFEPSSAGEHATAFIFTTTDCPIAGRYAPEMQRLFRTYAAQGIRFWLVYANPRESPDTIRAHARRFNLDLPIARDIDHDLIRQLQITVTPEAAVVDRAGRVLYRGRIDDRVTDFGIDRPVPTRRELEQALGAIVRGQPVLVATTRAVGCFVADFKPVTFNRDIAPLMFDRCASCHRPSGPAPFSLMTFQDVRTRASLVATVTERKFMPPWKADAAPGQFVGQHPLDAAEVRLIRQWVDEGTVEGDPADLPAPPRFAEGWHLGTPDLVVRPSEPYVLGPGPSDAFRIFVIPLPIDRVRYVTGIEFHPGNARVVHHANIRVDRTRESRTLDQRDPAPGYDGLMARTAVYPEGHFLGWTPGQVAPLVPGDMAWPLEPGTDLVVQLHLQPSGAQEVVQPTIGVFFGDRRPTRMPTILRLGSQGIDIPPGEAAYHVTDSYLLPADVELHAVQPHAHYRLKSARGVATLPDGTERTLIRIDDWDFRWQHVYRLSTPMALPRGTRVSMHYRYDNSADNPRNPQAPPTRVLWGQRSFDEMGDLWFQFVAKTDGDRARLTAEIQRKMTAEDVIGYETMLRADADDAELHDDVALLYLALGRAGEAVEHFRASTMLKPQVAATHFNLGTALSVAGRLDEAVTEYQRALALRPDYGSAHNNLGSVLAARGQVTEALGHFREAVRHDADNVQGHRNLAWYVATTPGGDATGLAEAVAAGERASRLTANQDPQVLDALAAAYAAAGQFARAVETGTRAMRLATDQALVNAIQQRLALYRQGRPYRLMP
jgi:tetratricopeptide (TPR) repeat protein